MDVGAAEPNRRAGQGFCLVMRLANPARLPELLLALRPLDELIKAQLKRLKYVHYSRFVPIVDRGVLLIVTEFDGEQEDYVMDFATVLDSEFSLILGYMEGAPRLPVSRYPHEFYSYVARNSRLFSTEKVDPRPFSAYPDRSVLDLMGDLGLAAHSFAVEAAAKEVLAAAASKGLGDEKPEWSDVQANVVQGLRALRALHISLSFKTAAGGRTAVAGLAQAVTWQDQAAAAIAEPSDSAAAGFALNLGLTFEGLTFLEVPAAILREFPQAYKEGPALRADRLGDVGPSAAANWLVGQPDPKSPPLHAVLSLWAKTGTAGDLDRRAKALLEPLAQEVERFSEQAAARFAEDDETVHFGYRDNISQPRIQGLVYKNKSRSAVPIPVGDILLGPDYPNSRGSSPIADLPPALAKNSTYAAFRVIEQHVKAFNDLLAHPEIDPPLPAELDPTEAGELIAAKLLGRWRNGMPLASGGEARVPQVPPAGIDDEFDFWQSPNETDRAGSGCPFGAHIRRMNPRTGIVVGVPQGRRIIRRAMPYGPQRVDDAAPRGLVGLFFCADLANQFEFIQHAWANGDVSAPGLAGSVDPFIGVRNAPDQSTPFVFQHAGETHTLKVPRLTTVRGSAYLLMPSKTALDWLAGAMWQTRSKVVPAAPSAREPIESDAPGAFNVGDPRFAQMPHRFYAHWRKQGSFRVGPPYDAEWVLSYAAVEEALRRETDFLKPGKGRGGTKPSPFAVSANLDDGLFFQDLLTHERVRPPLRTAFDTVATQERAGGLARAKAEELLDAAVAKGILDVVSEFAAPLTTHVFMSLALPPPAKPFTDPRKVLDAWVRKALAGHDENAPIADRQDGGSASFALRGWLHAYLQGAAIDNTIFGAIKGCPARMNDDASTNTALHFALGGYLSTEFLITTGVFNLLSTNQWAMLRDDRSLMPSAIEEMLRFDAPFMMADRWAPNEVMLAGKPVAGNVTLVYGAANRDPAVFVDPDTFDIRRFAKRRPKKPLTHFGFGLGQYNCIGQDLARWTATSAFNALLDRYPKAHLGEVGAWLSDPYYRSLKRLTLTA